MRVACSAEPTCPTGSSDLTVTSPATPYDSGANVLHPDPGSASYRADSGSHATSAAITSATTANVDATKAKGQVCEVRERSSPCFSHSVDPMNAKDWLRALERELHTTQCNVEEKVLYGPRLLWRATESWWESYLATHADPEAITWEEFRDKFPLIPFSRRHNDSEEGGVSEREIGLTFFQY
jgi:hypothetical protein